MTRTEMEDLIKSAFQGVTLERGSTLIDLDEMSHWGVRANAEDIRASPDAEITNDWTAVTLKTMERFPSLAQADAKTMRYYLPAFMLSLFSVNDNTSIRVITTYSALNPEPGKLWDHTISRYALFDEKQVAACALFVRWLPALVELDKGDRKIVKRAMRNYWRHRLPTEE